MNGKTDVVVVGGGYAGVMAANRLTQRDDVAVTLINPRPQFVNRIRLYRAVRESGKAVVDFREMLAPDIRLVVDSAAGIDVAGRRVKLASGDTVSYDYLIYAVGSASAEPRVPGAAEFAYPVATLEEAQRARLALDAAPRTAPVTVVGAGTLGMEVAAELADMGRTVTLICGEVLGPDLHPRIRRAVYKRMAKLGVNVIEGSKARVTAVERDAVQLGDGRRIPGAVTIWTTGFGVPDLAARSGLTTNAEGRLITDETLTSVDDPRIVATGDAAAPSDMPLRMCCQAAIPLGAHAADTVLARIAVQQPAPIEIGFFGFCVALGQNIATVQLSSRDDTVNRFSIGGRLGGMVKETSFDGLVKQLAKEGRKPGSYSWLLKDRKRQRRLQAMRDNLAMAH